MKTMTLILIGLVGIASAVFAVFADKTMQRNERFTTPDKEFVTAVINSGSTEATNRALKLTEIARADGYKSYQLSLNVFRIQGVIGLLIAAIIVGTYATRRKKGRAYNCAMPMRI